MQSNPLPLPPSSTLLPSFKIPHLHRIRAFPRVTVVETQTSVGSLYPTVKHSACPAAPVLLMTAQDRTRATGVYMVFDGICWTWTGCESVLYSSFRGCARLRLILMLHTEVPCKLSTAFSILPPPSPPPARRFTWTF